MIDVYWLEQSAGDVPVRDGWLSPNETARLAGLRFPKRRHDWRLGRWTAKRAVAVSIGAPLDVESLANIEIWGTPSGAPQVLISGKPAAMAISLSHRGERAACAVILAGTAVGCDLEIIEPRNSSFVTDFFTPEEQEFVEHAAAGERWRVLALLWSAKESVLKALRVGLTLDTRCVTVFPGGVRASAGGRRWRPLQARCTSGEIFKGWWQDTNHLVRTLVATPAPDRPLSLG